MTNNTGSTPEIENPCGHWDDYVNSKEFIHDHHDLVIKM